MKKNLQVLFSYIMLAYPGSHSFWRTYSNARKWTTIKMKIIPEKTAIPFSESVLNRLSYNLNILCLIHYLFRLGLTMLSIKVVVLISSSRSYCVLEQLLLQIKTIIFSLFKIIFSSWNVNENVICFSYFHKHIFNDSKWLQILIYEFSI